MCFVKPRGHRNTWGKDGIEQAQQVSCVCPTRWGLLIVFAKTQHVLTPKWPAVLSVGITPVTPAPQGIEGEANVSCKA